MNNIASLGVALPEYRVTQEQGYEFMKKYYQDTLNPKNKALLRALFMHKSVRQRHFAMNKPEELIAEDPDIRAARFTRSAVQLSKTAVSDSLRRLHIGPADVAGLVVNTCTGYICPGISTYLIEEMGFNRSIAAYDLLGAGCGGAVPNLNLCGSILSKHPGGVVVSVSVEICSCTFRMADDTSLLVSNALFGDGACASVLWDRPGGLALIDSASDYLPEYREDIRFIHKGGQLYNQLSARLPDIAGKAVAGTVRKLLDNNGLCTGDIKYWAVHPGGERILSSIETELELDNGALSHSRAVLSRYGNMSSSTVGFVLKDILDSGLSPGDYCLMAAFGAGFSVHTALLKA